MLILPIGDENPTARTPWVNYTLITLNVLIFLILGFTPYYERIIMEYSFIPAQAVPYTFITSLFLHGSLAHLFGNMLFLWIVGDNIEDELGHFWYLLFYLAAGASAAFFHMILIPQNMLHIPTIGASGAISAVLGAYLLIFPRNRIIFFWFLLLIWGRFKVASIWAIGLWFALQLVYQLTDVGTSSVAYGAHIGGFVVGVAIAGILALTGIIPAFWKKKHTIFDIKQEEEKK